MKLTRAGYLAGLQIGTWQWNYADGSKAWISIAGGRDAIRLDYRVRSVREDWQSVSQRVPIRWTPCRFGGERPWFICDVSSNGVYCGRRVVKLYSGGRLFACRHCYRLGYAVQRGGPIDRGHHRLARLHRKLGADYDGPDTPPPRKPKWMRWKTYSQITQQIEAGEERLDVVLTVGAERLLARLENLEHPQQETASMGEVSRPAEVAIEGSYETTRFNALRHGILSRYVVLPWEDEAEYQALLSALAAEYAPEGPTEEHLVEELAGIIWRKRRVRMAEAAIYREKIRQKATDYIGPDQVASAALLPLTGAVESKASIAQAIVATAGETTRDLRDTKRDQGMTQRALTILETGSADAYQRALDSLRDDTREYWRECLRDPPDDGMTYVATAEALKAWVDRHWREWYVQPIAELQHRDAIRDQALGIAYGADGLELPAKYEIHLDRKLERTLSMLLKLRELR